jgi:glutaredoxin-like protein
MEVTVPFLDDELTKQVAGVLAPLENEVELVVYTGSALQVPGRDPAGEQKATLELLREVAATSEKVTVLEKNLILDDDAAALGITLAPTTLFRRKGEDRTNLRFVGLPSGYEFSTLLETILMVGASEAPSGVALADVADIQTDLRLRTFVTPTCPHCPKSVITSFRFALVNPRIVAEGIEANEFPTLSSGYRISGVPDTIVEGRAGSTVKSTRVLGAQPEAAFVGALRQAVGVPQEGQAAG